ncbi:MAG: bifunctional hydroxymethylpyrimidine kinase/phosphomethylpyrimidine kinase [Myxococcales bacterium]|nr:bifunctional hydroxymethylpyrimidine kinase/phosphomethylpyrimidine kinase [Myxococcales bacterium]
MTNPEPKVVLSIAGSDSGGGAGIQADIKTIEAHGAFAMTAVTAVTAQNSRGVQGIFSISPEMLRKQIQSVFDDFPVAAVKTGMLYSSAHIRVVVEELARHSDVPIVVDPVMVAKGGASLLDDDSVDDLVERLIPMAAVVTPNIPEACRILRMRRISSIEERRLAASLLHRMGSKAVVIKGGHLDGKATDLLYDGRQFRDMSEERVTTKHTHGTGCAFSAAIASNLAYGKDAAAAVVASKQYVHNALLNVPGLGSGHGPLGFFHRLAPIRLVSADDAALL